MITLTIVDIVLILILLFLFTIGFVYGLITALGRVISIIVGIWGAYQYTPFFTQWLAERYTWIGGIFSEIILFVVLAGIIMKFVQLLFWAFDWLLDLISFIPFLSFFNRVLGGVFALTLGGIALGLSLHFILGVSLPLFGLSDLVTASEVGPKLIFVGGWLSSGIPEVLTSIRQLIF